MEDIEVKGIVPARPDRVLGAWLDGAQHAAMTGGAATGIAEVGAAFTAWDGYITGRNLEIGPDRIVQSWRTSEFPKKAKDSRVEVRVAAHPDGTEITLVHTGIPKGQGKSYEKGWVDHYFEPMRDWFARTGT
jgi:activator of HSP90 ATPase